MRTRTAPPGNTPALSPWISREHRNKAVPPGPIERYPFQQLLVLKKVSILPYLRNAARNYGDLVHVKFKNFWVYLVSNPNDIQLVLQKQHRKFIKGFAADLVRDVLGYGIFAAEGDFHKQQQKIMQPAFRNSQIERYAEMMFECFDICDHKWRDGDTIDIVEEMSQLTMNVAVRTLFNMPPTANQTEISKALAVVLKGMVDRVSSPIGILKATFPIFPDKQWKDALFTLDKVIYSIIERHQSGQLPDDDLLGQLMNARDEQGKALSTEQLRDEVLTLFVAGHETTAIALTWAFHELTKNSEIKQKIVDEISEVCQGKRPSYADLPKLQYCKKVFQESLRHYPPLAAFMRQSLEETHLNDFTIPAGSIFIISPYIVHHNPKLYPDPESFNPSRWSTEFSEKLHQFAFIPFSGGPRVCIGERFAWCEGTLALAYFLQKWDFELLPYQEVHINFIGTMRPSDKIEMKLSKKIYEPCIADIENSTEKIVAQHSVENCPYHH